MPFADLYLRGTEQQLSRDARWVLRSNIAPSKWRIIDGAPMRKMHLPSFGSTVPTRNILAESQPEGSPAELVIDASANQVLGERHFARGSRLVSTAEGTWVSR